MSFTSPVAPIKPPSEPSPWMKFVNEVQHVATAVADKFHLADSKVPDTAAQAKEKQMKQAARDKIKSTELKMIQRDNPLSRAVTPINDAFATVQNKSSDILLEVAKQAQEKIISPVFRAASTAGILADPNSDIYKKDVLGKGFQPKDVVTAWNRSKKVSLMQALASNPFIIQPYSPAQGLSDFFGGPDFAKVNVFSDSSVKENYEDNIFGKYFTGFGDVAVSFPVFSGLGKAGSLLGKYAATSTGLVANGGRLEKAVKFEDDVKVGLDHISSGGTLGVPTQAAKDVANIAASENASDVYKVFRPYSNNRDLIPFLVKETDPLKVADLILADNKYLPAMERVLTHNDVAAYAAMGGHEAMVSKLYLSGGTYAPEDAVMTHIRDIHIKSINEIPEHKAIWDALMDPKSGSPLGLGKDKYKFEGPIGNAIGEAGRFTTQYLGSHNNVVTQVVRIVGTRLPRQYVSFSKSRTWDGVEELKSEFDSVKLFNNPSNKVAVSALDSVTAKEFRDTAISTYLEKTNDMDRYAHIKELDKQMGRSIAMSMGIHDMQKVDSIISELQSELYGKHSAITQKGYGMDIGGEHLQLDIHAQTQLAGAYRMIPWGQVERAMKHEISSPMKQAGMVTADVVLSAFNSTIKALSFSMIAKPSYIVKQSLLEPTIGGVLALGPKYVTSQLGYGLTHTATNDINRIKELIQKSKDLTSGERRSAINEISRVGNQLSQQVNIHNLLQQEFDDFFILKTKTAKTVEIHGPEVIAQYKASSKAVRMLEEQYNKATIRWGKAGEIPSYAEISRRLDYLAQVIEGGSPKILSDLMQIRYKLGLENKKRLGTSIFDDGDKIAAKEADLVQSYADVDRIIANLSDAQKARYKVFEKTAKNKERVYGKGDRYEFIDGHYMLMPKVYDDATVGAALREETSNAPTVLTNYGEELMRTTRAGIYSRHNPKVVTQVNDPRYYDELASFVNLQWKQDTLYNQILSGTTKEDVLLWARSGEGKTYMNNMGLETSNEVSDFVGKAFDRVDTYLPSVELQRLIANGKVLAPGFEKHLHPYVGQLMPIHPRDFNYEEINSGLGRTHAQTVVDLSHKFLNSTFKTLMKPENPLRWSFIEQRATQITANKARMLVEQGKTVGPNELNALSQASFQEAVAEMEKTFYTITRANKIIYQSRILSMFPTATMNAFYRYARLAVQHPVRTLGFLHYYDSMFKSFGVDQYGNPTDDVMKVTHIVVPGTKDMGLFNGEGMRIGVKSIGFILNAPSLGPIMALPISYVIKSKPSLDDAMKNILGSTYSQVFPYGTTAAGVAQTAVPAWARDLLTWAQGSSGSNAYRISMQSVYDYHKVLVTMGVEKEMPTSKQLNREVSDLWGQRGRYEFASPVGMPVKIDTSPMTLYRQLYYNLMNANRAMGMSMDEAQAKAEAEFLGTVGSKFPMDTITNTGTTSKAFIAQTQEGFDRVFNTNSALTKQLVHIFPKDPFVVSLLTADIEVTPANRSQAISQKLGDKNMTLPDINGTILLNDPALTPQQVQEQRDSQATWDAFFAAKQLLDDTAKTIKSKSGKFYKSMDSIPEYRAALSDYAENVLGKKNPTWLSQDYNAGGGSNRTYIYATGFDMIVRNQKFMEAHGTNPYWKDALAFTKIRNLYVDLYQLYPEGKERTAIKQAYQATLFGDASQGLEGKVSTYDPQLQKIITRYFLNDSMVKVGKHVG